MGKALYQLFAYLGLMTFGAAFLYGFRHAPGAPLGNVLFDVVIYALFIGVHIVMTMPAFKRAVYGRPEGTPTERRVYIGVTVVTWLLVVAFHRPVPGFGFDPPGWVVFLGLCAVLFCVVAFFEFATLEGLGSLLGVPGSELAYSVGEETPLMTEGSYAQVRHPMYRAAFGVAFASLLVHPNAGQLLFAVLVSASFLGFVPFEEGQLLRARGEAYRAYMERTPWRVFRGVW